MVKLVSAAFLAALLIGCSGAGQIPPQERQIQRSVTLDQSYEGVWSLVVEWFVLRGTPFDTMDKEDGVITSGSGLRASYELDCGKAAGRVSYAAAKMENVRGQINVVVRERGEGKTQVLISVFGGAESVVRNMYGHAVSSAKAECVSTGELEAELIEYLQSA